MTDVMAELAEVAASAAIEPAALGRLTRIAAAIHRRGPLTATELTSETGVVEIEVQRLRPWLRLAEDKTAFEGLVVRAPANLQARGAAPSLFASLDPPPLDRPGGEPSRGSRGRLDPRGNALAAMITLGVQILREEGRSEAEARRIIGKLRQEYRDGPLLEALLAVSRKSDPVAQAQPYVRRYLERNFGALARKPEAGARQATAKDAAVSSPPTSTRPLVTPENCGVSPGMAAKIRKKNREIAIQTGRRPPPTI